MDWRSVEAVTVGLVSGYMSGQLGIGGSVIATPAIRVVLGYPAMIAVGTPLAAVIPAAVTSATRYARASLVDWSLAWRAGATGIAGAIGGAYATRFLSGSSVLLATSGLLLLTALGMARSSDGTKLAPRLESEVGWVVPLIGLGAGFFSGFFGLGGGTVLVPAFVVLGRDAKVAFGTSLVVVSALAIPGTIVHWLLGHIDVSLALLLTAGAIPGAWLGANVAIRLPDRVLRLLFAVFLAVLALVLAGTELARMRW